MSEPEKKLTAEEMVKAMLAAAQAVVNRITGDSRRLWDEYNAAQSKRGGMCPDSSEADYTLCAQTSDKREGAEEVLAALQTKADELLKQGG